MAIFDSIKRLGIIHRKSEERLYFIVSQEMEQGIRNNGLWIKALVRAKGNKKVQVAEYIKLRVQSLKDDVSILSEMIETGSRISLNRDIEDLIVFVRENPATNEIAEFFSGMSPQATKALINQPDANEDYPIHVAIKKSHMNIARWLLSAGANPTQKNYWGRTALEIAEKNGDHVAIALLREFGCGSPCSNTKTNEAFDFNDQAAEALRRIENMASDARKDVANHIKKQSARKW